MKKIICLLVIISILLVTGCSVNKTNNEVDNTTTIEEKVSFMKVIINNQEYTLKLADTKAAQQLYEYAPLNVTMKDLNGNEKYIYLSNGFTTDPFKPTRIEKGDVMLFDNSCIVIFYKSFNTSDYSYTSLGHIDDLPDFDESDIKVKFQK